VQEIAVAIGNELDLDGPEVESLSFAALFHDVGKLAVPDSLLLKSGPFDEKEWRIVRRHAEEGERIIGHLGFLSDAAPRPHPRPGTAAIDELRGQEIRSVLASHVSDAFDSMISDRVPVGADAPEASPSFGRPPERNSVRAV
jgi:response regulator RpfG family c-di-GMP phosphodiesterase